MKITEKLNQAFFYLWAGQSLSLLGTGMTRFAVMIWAFEKEQNATSLALLGFFTCLTYVLTSPVSGVLVDRWDRRKVMLLSDLGAALFTAWLLWLHSNGLLEIWHLYVAIGAAGFFEAFQDPASTAAISMLVPKTEYTRANGLIGLGKSAARILAPAFAGLLLSGFGLSAVMVIDLVTASMAMTILLFIRIPIPKVSKEGELAKGSILKEMRFGMTYIFKRPGLRGILSIFFLINLFSTITYFAIMTPMILARSGNDEVALGVVRTVMGVGGVAGGLMISIWGGPKRKARVFLITTTLSFLVCDFMTAVSRSWAGWSIAGFLAELSIPFIVSPYYAIWQEIVPPDVQGKVFSTREMLQVLSQPFGYLLGGLLADHLFEPWIQSQQGLAGFLSTLVGTGPGSGMAAMFVFTSMLGALTGVLGLLSPSIRALDRLNPSIPVQGRTNFDKEETAQELLI